MKTFSLIFGLLIAGSPAPAQQYVASTIAGTPGTAGYAGDGGPGVSAQLSNPLCMVADSHGNLFFVDYGNAVIRELSTTTGIIKTIAGTGTQGFSGDGGPASAAQFGSIHGLAVDTPGNLYVSDTTNYRVRKINTNGIITTIAGNGTPGGTGNFGPAVSAELIYPAGLAVDSKGDVYVADFGTATVREITASGTILPIAGVDSPGFNIFSGDGGPAYKAILGAPLGLAIDAAGNLYLSDVASSSIRKIDANLIINTIVRNVSAASLTIDAAGNLYYADYHNAVIDKLAPGGTPIAFAGNQILGYSGNGGPGSYAEFSAPYSVALDSFGNVYVTDFGNDVIRSLTPLPAASVIVANGASNVGYGPGSGALPLVRSRAFGPLLSRRPEVQTAAPAGANNSPLAIAPGEIVTIFGSDGLGASPAIQAQPDVNGLIEIQLGPTLVTFNGIPGPVLASGNNQVTAIVPYEIANASQANVVVLNNGQVTGSATVPVGASAPGIITLDSSEYTASGFTGSPVLNADGTVNAVGNGAVEASNITLYETGEGQTNPGGIDGLIATGPTFPAPVQPITVTIGGTAATVVSASAVQGEVAGIMQIVVTLPTSVTTSNSVPVTVTVGSAVSPTITIAVQ